LRRGGKKTDLASSLFFFRETTPVRSSLTLFLFLSLALFMLTVRRFDWDITLGVWAIGVAAPCLFSMPLLPRLKKMGIVLPFILITILIHALFTPGTLIAHRGDLMITREGIEKGLWISHKIVFFFWISFIVSESVPENALFRWMGVISRLPVLNKLPVRLWMITLFLLLRWLGLLPIFWKRRLTEALKDVRGKRARIIRGVEALPGILKQDILELDAWVDLLILRGYGEGVLWIADSRSGAWRPADWFLLTGVFALWAAWGFYMK